MVQHLVADRGDREEEGRANTHREREGATPEGDLVHPEVGGICVGQEFLSEQVFTFNSFFVTHNS